MDLDGYYQVKELEENLKKALNNYFNLIFNIIFFLFSKKEKQ